MIEPGDDCDYVVCVPPGPSPWRDNEIGRCSMCQRPIMFRPDVPKRPPKICVYCLVVLIEQGKVRH